MPMPVANEAISAAPFTTSPEVAMTLRIAITTGPLQGPANTPPIIPKVNATRKPPRFS